MRNLTRQFRTGKIQRLKETLKRANKKIQKLQNQLQIAQQSLEEQRAKEQAAKKNRSLREKIRNAKRKIRRLEKQARNQEKLKNEDKKVVVDIIYYIEAETESEKKRKSIIVHPIDGTIGYPRGTDRVILTEADVAGIKKFTFVGTETFPQISRALINVSESSRNLFQNSASKVVAIKRIIQGYATPVETQLDHEIDRPIAGDGELRAINCPFINNSTSLFKPRPKKHIGNIRIKKNSCLETLMLQEFKENLEKKFKITLTYESIWDICCPGQPYPENGEFQLSLRQAKRFFEHFKLKLIAIDLYNNIMMYYDPNDTRPEGSKKTCEYHWKGSTILRVLVHQNHAYLLDHNVNSFDRTFNKLAEEFQQSLQVSSHYYLREELDENAQYQVLLDSPAQIQKYITNFKKPATFVKILTQYPIELLYREFQHNFGITGSYLKTKRSTMYAFQLQQKNTIFEICSVVLKDDQPDLWFEDEASYKNYLAANKPIHRELFNDNHLSHYNQQFYDIMTTFTRGPLMGMFAVDPLYNKKGATCLDMIKAYTARVLQMQNFPIGDQFCFFEPYKPGTQIEDYNLYIVQKFNVTKKNEIILFNQTTVVTSGITVKYLNLKKIKHEIIAHWQPWRLGENTIEQFVKELWEDETLSIEQKKMIMNVNLGCLDKTYNTKIRGECFNNKHDAYAKQKKVMNSEVVPFSKHNDTDDDENNDLDFGLDVPPPKHEDNKVPDYLQQELYLLITTIRKQLQDGFLPISFMKYDLQRLELSKMCFALEKFGIEVKGINVDSLFIAHGLEAKLEAFKTKYKDAFAEDSDAFDSIGKWKVQKNKRCSNSLITQKQNSFNIDLHNINLTHTKPDYEQEWETNPKYLQSTNKILATDDTLVLSKHPGCGKSHTVMDFLKSHEKYLVVHPFNNQKEAMKRGYNAKAVTTNRLLGLSKEGDRTRKAYDITGVTAILFDEILMNDDQKKWKITEFKKQHPEIRFLGTGDPCQLQPIEKYPTNRSGMKCLDILFPQRLNLEVIKRVKDPQDRQGYETIWHCLFELHWSVQKVVQTYPHFFGNQYESLDEITTETNISFTNPTRKTVNKHIHETVHQKTQIEPGQVMICKEFVKAIHKYSDGKKKLKALCVNRKYTVTSITETEVVIDDQKAEKRTIHIDRKKFDKSLQLPYCQTTHSLQGLTLDKDITLFDWHEFNVTRDWFWTSITRTTSLKLIHFYNGLPITNTPLHKQIKRKLESYKKSDRKKGIYDEKNFIDEEWIKQQLERVQWVCPCGCQLTLEGKHQWSVDRIDNTKGHTKQNCRIICLSCNCAKH
jgi:hypothetical protein